MMQSVIGGLLFTCLVVACVHSQSLQPVGPGETSPVEPFPRCGPVCMIYCPFGNVMDSRGCPTCTCRTEPQRCPEVRCSQICPSGFKMVDGCQTCQCKEPLCGPVCEIACRYGKVLDSQGCPTCRCRNKPVCPLVKCARRCPNGYKTVDGCRTCQCNDERRVCTGLRTCRRFCLNGFMKDSNGCSICRCRPGVGTLRPPFCPQVLCAKPCPNGYMKKNGCQTCQCLEGARPKPLCGPTCRMGCPNGFVEDSNGCPICKCKPVAPRSCRRQCLRSCLRRSMWGRQTSSSGCDCDCSSYRRRLSPIRSRSYDSLALP